MQPGQGGAEASEWSLRIVTAVFVHSNLSLRLTRSWRILWLEGAAALNMLGCMLKSLNPA